MENVQRLKKRCPKSKSRYFHFGNICRHYP
nr:MAG TPA: hypothetical protein [Caudoviricetes sp.]